MTVYKIVLNILLLTFINNPPTNGIRCNKSLMYVLNCLRVLLYTIVL